MRYLSLFSGIEAASVAWRPLGWEPVAFSEVDPFCCDLLEQRFPSVPNLGDVTAEDFVERAKALGRIDLIVGGSPCFPDGALVLCRRGLVPIDGVVVGDEVLTHAGRYRRVRRVGSRKASTVVVKGQGHEGLEATREHPILSRSFRRAGWERDEDGKAHPHREWSEPEWTPAEKMFHRFWAQPASFPPCGVPPITKEPGERIVPELSRAFWWMIGAYVGNGWTRAGQRSGRPEGQENGNVIICAGPHKADAMESSLAETGLTWTRVPQRTAVRFVTGSLAFRRWVEVHFGKYAAGKTVPAWLLGQPEDVRRSVLDGYMATDGSEQENGYSATTVSRRLAYGLKMLWHSLGRSVSVSRHVPRRKHAVIEGRVVNERPQYHVMAYRSARSSVELDGMRYGCVRKVLPGRSSVRVHNLEVEEDESYTVDGVVVHNCQSFSVAGLRKGLHDDRGNLTLRFVEVVNGIDPEFVVWENVPGVLNHPDNPFGCFLAGLVGADAAIVPGGGGPGLDDRKAGAKGRWTGAGLALGPLRAASWRILDAQWYGVAQRRRRVFVVSGRAGDARCSEILLESAGVLGDPPTRRASGQGPARDVAPCLGASGRGVERGGESRGQDPVVACFGGNRTGGELDVATAQNAHGGTGRLDFESETFVASALRSRDQARGVDSDCTDTFVAEKAPSLCAGGKAAGSATQQDAESGALVASTTGKGFWSEGVSALRARSQESHEHLVAFSSKDYGADAGDVAPTLRAAGHDSSHANAGAPPAVAFLHCNKGRPDGRKSEHTEMVTVEEETIPTIATDGHAQSAVAFRAAGQDGFTPSDVAQPVAATDGGGAGAPIAFHATQDPISGDVSPCLGQGNAHSGAIATAYGISSDAVDRSGEGDGSAAERAGFGIVEDAIPSLRSRPTNSVAAPMDGTQSVALRGREGGGTAELGGDQANSLRSSSGGGDKEHVLAPTQASSYAIRRLTPRECCRLQGFPDDWTLVSRRAKSVDPLIAGPCAKQVVTATVVSPSGKRYQATNWCMSPQKECPRAGMPSGEGYELCRTVCAQHAHAEVNALKAAGEFARGGRLYVEGHTYACGPCLAVAKEAGIEEVVVGPPIGNASDGSRYKAIGNSMAVPVMAWIGRRIDDAARTSEESRRKQTCLK